MEQEIEQTTVLTEHIISMSKPDSLNVNWKDNEQTSQECLCYLRTEELSHTLVKEKTSKNANIDFFFLVN